MAALYPDDNTMSDDLLTCKLCNKTLNHPKLLPCPHSFCKDCLIKNMTPPDFAVTCPCCERSVKVENGDMDQLPDNYLFPILQEQRAASVDNCLSCQFDNKETKATHKCLDCQDTFCGECKKFHNFSSQTRNHKIVDIKDIKKEFKDYMKLRKIKICSKHSTTEREIPLDLFCENCKCLVCKHGITTEHKFHSCIMLEDFEERVVLNKAIKQLEDLQDKASIFSDQLDTMSQSLKKKRGEAENQVRKAADELVALVDKVKEIKLQMIKTHYEEELKKVQVMKEKQLKVRNHTKTMKTFADAFMTQSSKVDFVNHFKDLEFRVKGFIEGKEDLCETTKHLNIENRPCADAIEVVNEILGKMYIQKKILYEGEKELGEVDFCGEMSNHVKRFFEVKKKMKEIGEPQVMFDVDSRMEQICGLALTDDNCIIAVSGSQMYVFSNDGVQKRLIQCSELELANGVTAKGNKTFVFDNVMGKRKVLVLDMGGVPQRMIRMPENEQKHDSYFGLAVDDRDNIYISSSQTHTVYKCTPESTTFQPFLTKSTKPGIDSPTSLCVTPKQELVLSNANNIQAYSVNGKLLWQYDGISSEVIYPKEICCDNEGRVYICDSECRIHVVKDGHFIGIIKPPNLSDESPLTVNSYCELITSTCRFIQAEFGWYNTHRITKITFWK